MLKNLGLRVNSCGTTYKIFPELSPLQVDRFCQLSDLYQQWNTKINVISRQDIDNLYLHHVLASLSIARVIRFKPGTLILDAGTGGGFPGIPLAILMPECEFYLTDSIGKKIMVVKDIASCLGLDNIVPLHARVETLKQEFDFAVSRALSSLPFLLKWISTKIRKEGFNDLPNGIFYLKGGNIEEELSMIKRPYTIYGCSQYFEEEYFLTKKIIYIR